MVVLSPPRSPARLRPRRRGVWLSVGIDFGGSTVKLNVVEHRDGKLKVLVKSICQIESFPGQGPAVTLRQIQIGVTRMLESLGLTIEMVDVIGVCSPGPATADGRLRLSANLRHPAWKDYPLRAKIAQLFGRPTAYINDANSAGLGESTSIRGKHNFLLAQPGSGLGGSFVVNGAVHQGATTAGYEIGHLTLTPDAIKLGELLGIPQCGCNAGRRRHHFESVVSLYGLKYQLDKALDAARHRERGYARWATHPLHELPRAGLKRAKMLRDLAGDGDGLAMLLFRRQARVLGVLLAQLIMTADPDYVRLGGGIASAEPAVCDAYLDNTWEVTAERIFPHQAELLQSTPGRFCWAKLDDRAGAIGAALHALQTFGLAS